MACGEDAPSTARYLEGGQAVVGLCLHMPAAAAQCECAHTSLFPCRSTAVVLGMSMTELLHTVFHKNAGNEPPFRTADVYTQ